MREKIEKWEAEIAAIAERQKEMIQKNNERIRELRKKIQETEVLIQQEDDRRLAQAVREVFGDLLDGAEEESLESMIRKMESLKSGSILWQMHQKQE